MTGDVAETFPKVGGVLICVFDDLDTSGFIEGPNVYQERVKITDYCIRKLSGVSLDFQRGLWRAAMNHGFAVWACWESIVEPVCTAVSTDAEHACDGKTCHKSAAN